MSQIQTKWIANNAVTAAKLGSASATSTQALFADGSGNAAYRSIVSGDLPSLASLYLALTGGTMTGTITSQSIVPSAASTYNLGASGNNFLNGYFSTVNTGTINKGLAGTLLIETTGAAGGITIQTVAGNIKLNPSTAIIDASSANIQNLLDPVNAQDAMTLNYAGAHYLALSGGTMTGAIAMGSHKITGLASGTTSGDALQWGQIGVANGIAGLDGGGKVPLSQLPSALMEFQGNWNPSTNTPSLVDGTGTTGFTYWVSTAYASTVSGLTDPSMVNFQVGDLVIYNGTKWVLATPAAGVQSVNGSQGAVTVNAISQLTGDATAGPASGSQSQVLTLATVNSNVGSFGGASSVPSFTVNAKGLLTAASATAVVAPAGTLSGTTLNSTVVSSSLTSVGTLTGGTWKATAIGPTYGGTGLTSYTTGDILYASATNVLSKLGIGSTNQVLTVIGGIPSWQSPAAAPTANKETFVLSSGDITNQYIDLGHVAKTNSIVFQVVGGGIQAEGASYDYSVSYTGGSGGNTRITFLNGLATGGVSALVASDVLQINYTY